MHSLLTVLLMAAAAVAAAFVNVATAEPPTEEERLIDSLAWLAGHWKGELAGNPFETFYSTPEGGFILGISKEFHDNGTFIEFEKFEDRDSTVIVVPYPNGRRSVEFTLTDFDPSVQYARFVNPDHDFPNEIVYTVAGDTLTVVVSGGDKDDLKSFSGKLLRIR